jgi:hypothetical protein
MTPEQHSHLMEHFDAACDLDASGQTAYLAQLAEQNRELAQELAGMLHHDRVLPRTVRTWGAAVGNLSASGEISGASAGNLADTGETHPLDGLPDLEVVAALGEGGMGRVFLARQRSLDREVAVKVLKPEAASARHTDGLLAEAVLAGSLEHPNIVPVHMLLRDGQGLPALVMKRVEGVSWTQLLHQPEHPAWASLLQDGGDRLAAHLSILGGICHALSYAHSRGVIHRDVKPDNVMVGAFGEVYLVDWGIAARFGTLLSQSKPTGGGQEPRYVVGTPGYQAPEMVDEAAGPQDARTDVYLLGATLHYVLTGAPRHAGATILDRLLTARESRPVAYGPEIPEELAALCNRATSAKPAERPATAKAFREAITDYLHHRAAAALGEAAWASLKQLRTLLTAAAPVELRQLHALMTECQFGFHQSLHAWPGNPRSRLGLREYLITMVGYEVGQGNLTRAEALLAQLEDPPPELAEQVSALRERTRQRDERDARLRALEQAQDWRLGARQRVIFFLCTIGLLGAIWRIAVYAQRAAPDTIAPLSLAGYAAVAFAGIGLLVALFRQHLFITTVTRQLVLGVLCTIGSMCVSRALLALPAPSTAEAVSADQMLAAATAAVGGVMLARWIWWLVPIFLFGALYSRLVPTQAGGMFVVCATVACLLGLSMLRSGR